VRSAQGGDTLVVGAAVTRILLVPLTGSMHRAWWPVRSSVVVRNVATLGGNVAHGLPAADGTIALLALGAQAIVAGPHGRYELPLAGLFAAPGRLTLAPRESLLIGFRFPARGDREGSAFHRVMRPQGVAIAILNMALWLRLDATETIAEARLALGPGGPTPRRFEGARPCCAGSPHPTPSRPS
jgi:carbon-monoxide dehydrogenase medium subunit